MTNTIIGAYVLNLQLFAEGAEGGASTSAESAPVAEEQNNAAAQSAPAAAQTADAPVDLDAEFENLVKGKYKAQYGKRVESTVQSRLKGTNAQLSGYRALAEAVADLYGIDDPSDIDKLRETLDNTERPGLEERAFEAGVTKEQKRYIESLEAKNRRFERERRKEAKEAQERQQWAERFAEADALKQKFPGFDFDVEMNGVSPENIKFREKLAKGYSVEDAYCSAHFNELFNNAMVHTAAQVEEGVVNKMRAQGMRPAENGASGVAPAQVKVDPSKFSAKQIDEYIERAQRGERVTFS